MSMKNYLILAMLFFVGQSIYPQTPVPGGAVSGIWDAAGSPYLVQNAISVDYGQTLSIEAGCEIIFQPGIEFLVNGTLEVNGTAADSVSFKCNMGSWEGFQIVGIWEYNHSTFKFCSIENASVGILTFYTGSVSVSDSRIRNNLTGMHIQHSSAYFNNIEVYNNSDAGIMMSDNCCNMDFLLSDFNIHDNGGRGLEFNFDSGGTQEISNGSITNNAGGGIFSSSSDGYVSFTNLMITQNGPTDFGGGIHAYAACLIENCTIENNSADYGGGVYLRTNVDVQEIRDSKIIHNESFIDGGGLYLADGATDLFNTQVSNNICANNGAGIYIEKVNFIHGIQIRNLLLSENDAVNMGGGFYLENVDADLRILQSTISGNTAGTSGAALSFLSNPFNETVDINSCIFYNNSPDEIDDPVGGIELNYSNYPGGWAGSGSNNILEDPLFVADGMFAFDLAEGSPCINAGDPSILPATETDLAGRPRICNDTIDMGAFESGQLFGPTWGLEVKVWLEGAYSDGKLTSTLQNNDLLPMQQPFNLAPWNYNGDDSICEGVTTAISDWILIDLYDYSSAGNLCPCSRFYRKAFPISQNGDLINESGVSTIKFMHQFKDSLFIALRHRNHLDILSAEALPLTDGIYSYNFTNMADKAFGGANAQTEVAAGIWAMKAGDINQNDTVSDSDIDSWAAIAGMKGYYTADLDFNGEIDNIDKNLHLIKNLGSVSMTPIGDTIFTCGEIFMDSINGICYPTEQIGDQCWMAKNLNIGIQIDSLHTATQNDTIEKYCYGDLEANCDIFGGLYTWDEMMKYSNTSGAQGICPNGWHIPTDEEWKTMEASSDSQFGAGDPEWDAAGWRGLDAGLNSKSETGWTQNGNGTNLYNFNALPAGYLEYTGGYFRLTEGAYFWSSTESDADHAWRRGFHFTKDNVHRWPYEKAAARSVRCLKD
ncbi:MAG TPA: FISUMP domain-containing protein [Bacteroidales bacterium]|nr:FISUMP domain-containing protein [Bacteroidales bacterium]